MNGWIGYIIEQPDPDALVRFWNEYSGEKWTGYLRDLNPEFNCAYLWWKLTGIEREKSPA